MKAAIIITDNKLRFSVLPDTTLFYIGDSVLSGLHEEKMGCSERDKSQVIFTSGLTLAGLISKLSNPVQLSRKVTCVNVHVGINDCRNGRVKRKKHGAMPYTHYVVVFRQQESTSLPFCR